MCRVRSISRKGRIRSIRIRNPQRPYARRRLRKCGAVKRWSDLHGDMQSQAEMSWPPTPTGAGGNNNVGPYPMQPQET